MNGDPFDIREERTPPQSLSELQQEEQLRPPTSTASEVRGTSGQSEGLRRGCRRRDEHSTTSSLYSPGLGKTTLSHIISHELGVGTKITFTSLSWRRRET